MTASANAIAISPERFEIRASTLTRSSGGWVFSTLLIDRTMWRFSKIFSLMKICERLTSPDGKQTKTRSDALRLEERRERKECVRTCRYRWATYHARKKKSEKNR